MPGTTLRARPRAFGLQPGGSDDFPKRTEPAVFGCNEPGNDRLKDPLSRKLPGSERKAEICAGRSQALLRLVAASLPLPLFASSRFRRRPPGLPRTSPPEGSTKGPLLRITRPNGERRVGADEHDGPRALRLQAGVPGTGGRGRPRGGIRPGFFAPRRPADRWVRGG